jgi:arylsulfatase A-like enzyme
MGHAYSIHPEVVRVPLIVRVPEAMRRSWDWDEARPVFTTDVTPTLYRLLGHEWKAPAPFFGEPLARTPGTPPQPARDRMVAASYGAVYGAVLDEGRRYYVFDAIAMRELAFEIPPGPAPGTSIEVSEEIRQRGLGVIRTTVEQIAAFYKFFPPVVTAAAP